MPLKDIQCTNKECENYKRILEILVGINEELPKCDICASDNMQVMSACALNTMGCSAASKFGIH